MEKKNNKEYKTLKRYGLIIIGEKNKLIMPLLTSNINILHYITNENIYDVKRSTYEY